MNPPRRLVESLALTSGFIFLPADKGTKKLLEPKPSHRRLSGAGPMEADSAEICPAALCDL